MIEEASSGLNTRGVGYVSERYLMATEDLLEFSKVSFLIVSH